MYTRSRVELQPPSRSAQERFDREGKERLTSSNQMYFASSLRGHVTTVPRSVPLTREYAMDTVNKQSQVRKR